MADDQYNIQSKSKDLVAGKKLSEEDFLSIAKDRFKIALEAEANSRMEELDDIKFMVGDQWPLNIKSDRLRDQRPCLTINQIPQFVRQITNEQRQNRQAIQVNPVDDKASVETAEVLEGMNRHIEYASDADIAIDTAFEFTVKSGLGYFALTTDWASPKSFQQEIKYRQLKDRFSVYTDPYWQMPDGCDMQWGFIVSDPSKDEFQAEYPNAKLSQMSDWESLNKNSPDWFTKNTCKVAEYYYKIFYEEEICQLSDGREVDKKDIDALPKGLPDGVKIISQRKSLCSKVKWAKINGVEILEETDILGEYIPIIPVVGEEQVVEGKKIYAGIIRHLKDPQRMYNYFASAETEAIALAPRAPYVGAAGQFEGFEDKWQTANTKNHAFLEYNPQSSTGKEAPAPQRNVAEPAVQAITQAMIQRAQEMKATTGMYDPALGKQTNEMSGVAIQRRVTQSNTATFHFADNLSKSLRHAGRIILSWIPKIYNKAQAVRIIGEDGEVDFATINQAFEDGKENDGYHDLSCGRYDCTVSTGPSYQTKRQEALASMIDLTRAAPQAMQMGLDLLVGNIDAPGMKELAARIKRSLPPQITADAKDQANIPPEVQQKLSQYSQLVQGLSQEVNKLSQMMETKSLELASRERIEGLKAQNDLVIELLKHNAKDGQLAFGEEMKLLHKRLDMLGVNQPIDQVNNGDGGQGPAVSPQNNGTGAVPPGSPMGVQ